MLFLYLIKEKTFIDKIENSILDPVSQTKGVRFVVFQEYTSIFAIPAFPNGNKKVSVYATDDEHQIPRNKWTVEIEKRAKELKAEAKGTWKLFSLVYLFFALLLIGYWIGNKNKNNRLSIETEIQVYFKDPQVNDILYTVVSDGTTTYTSPIKITKIEGDSLFVVTSTLKGEFDNFHQDPSKIVKTFSITPADFTSDTIIFNKLVYNESNSLSKFGPSVLGEKTWSVIYIMR